ncbi:MAG: hypothetical protein P9L94_18930 [Candidatus Hinthialibacter antarcticus]|nr:hypothetical protein [Candidatus Hinthialibacter antarcticus]
MRKLAPYKTKRGAIVALDNGGRFYNFLTQADDGEISPAELGKAAGVFSSRQQMFLYLEMAIAELDDQSVTDIFKHLSPALKNSAKKFRPVHYTPAEATANGKPSKSAIVIGTPTYMESCSDFVGFIFIPISTGKTTTMMMVPIIDQYDVYEVRDRATDQQFLLAHTKGQKKLEPVETRFGGVIKKLQAKKGKPQKHKVFLETLYYTPNPKNRRATI